MLRVTHLNHRLKESLVDDLKILNAKLTRSVLAIELEESDDIDSMKEFLLKKLNTRKKELLEII